MDASPQTRPSQESQPAPVLPPPGLTDETEPSTPLTPEHSARVSVPSAPWTVEPFPSTGPLLRAAAGFLLLGLAAATGRTSIHAALALPPVVLGLAVVPGLIGAPALLVLHQHQKLEASPALVAQALTRAWMEAAGIAAGMAAVVLFFSLTSLLGTELLLISLAMSGWVGLSAARRRLKQAELAVGSHRNPGGLAWLWSLLTMAVGARLGWMAILWLRTLA